MEMLGGDDANMCMAGDQSSTEQNQTDRVHISDTLRIHALPMRCTCRTKQQAHQTLFKEKLQTVGSKFFCFLFWFVVVQAFASKRWHWSFGGWVNLHGWLFNCRCDSNGFSLVENKPFISGFAPKSLCRRAQKTNFKTLLFCIFQRTRVAFWDDLCHICSCVVHCWFWPCCFWIHGICW